MGLPRFIAFGAYFTKACAHARMSECAIIQII